MIQRTGPTACIPVFDRRRSHESGDVLHLVAKSRPDVASGNGFPSRL